MNTLLGRHELHMNTDNVMTLLRDINNNHIEPHPTENPNAI